LSIAAARDGDKSKKVLPLATRLFINCYVMNCTGLVTVCENDYGASKKISSINKLQIWHHTVYFQYVKNPKCTFCRECTCGWKFSWIWCYYCDITFAFNAIGAVFCPPVC